MRAIVAAALALVLGACGGSSQDDPRDECAALCERLPSRICGTMTEASCSATCEADHTTHRCWGAVMAVAWCIADLPDDECVDQDAECLDERAEMDACVSGAVL